jgi:PadR family transcriptional regulator AphA
MTTQQTVPDDNGESTTPAGREALWDGALEREPPPELPAEHALLGLLLLAGGTAHGYELARRFRRGQPLGDVIRLEQAMLYKHLKKLARLGWLTMTVEDQAPRPPRQVCHLTPAGEAELQRWLTEPVVRTREIRLEFLVKLYFALHIDSSLARRLASEQHAVVRQLADSLAHQLNHLSTPETVREPADDATFRRLVLQLRLDQTEAAAHWLDQVAQVVREPERGASPT